MLGAGSSHEADIDSVDIVLDLAGKFKPWGIPEQWSSFKYANKPRILDMYVTDMTAPYWVPKAFWKALWNDLVAEAASSPSKKLKVVSICIGGHGRTGTVLTALALAAGVVSKGDDPIAWLRKHYCSHALESNAQIAYLEETFKFSSNETPYKAPSATFNAPASPAVSALKPPYTTTPTNPKPYSGTHDIYDEIVGLLY